MVKMIDLVPNTNSLACRICGVLDFLSLDPTNQLFNVQIRYKIAHKDFPIAAPKGA